MDPYQLCDPGTDRSGKVGRAEELRKQHGEAGIDAQGAQKLASLARSAGHALMVTLVLTAPVSAAVFATLMVPEDYPASVMPEMEAAMEVLHLFFAAAGLIVWMMMAVWWLFVFLFTSGHHHLRPLHEKLMLPALLLYVAAFAPVLPYVAMGPWGGAA